MMGNTFDGTRSVTAIFDDAAKAERAVAWLRRIGLSEGQIRVTQERAPTHQAAPAPAVTPPRKQRRSLMDSLVDFVFPDDEPAASEDGLAEVGGRSVTVTDVPAALYDKVVSVLSEEGQIRLDAQRTDISDATSIRGFIGACLVDSESGLMLASERSEGADRIDFNRVAALNADTVRAKQTAVEQLGLGQRIEDILITLERQVHLIRPLERNRSMFVYVALDKASSNLGLARIQLKAIEANMTL